MAHISVEASVTESLHNEIIIFFSFSLFLHFITIFSSLCLFFLSISPSLALIVLVWFVCRLTVQYSIYILQLDSIDLTQLQNKRAEASWCHNFHHIYNVKKVMKKKTLVFSVIRNLTRWSGKSENKMKIIGRPKEHDS